MQRELVECALEGRSCIGILPTGSGKSLCYQIPAVLGNGLTVVVSPLIALMRDQVAGLEKLGVAAARYDSTLAEEDKAALMDRLKSGGVRLLFAAPESLESPWIQQVMELVPPGLFVVDEAHCLSEWGHSFRPDYLGLPVFFRKHGFRSVMALTATATEQVCRDLAGLFGVSDECIFRAAPYRANIFRQVETLKDQDKTARLVELLKEGGRRPAVVYTRTRKDAENLSYELGKAGFSVKSYHAGMPPETRGLVQDEFLAGTADVLVATIAFGMGIDKSNVRFVVHYNMPKNMESYYQEAGRAGRDGEPSECILLYGGQDVVTNQFFIDHNQDNEALDPITREIVMERDRERLRKMTFYCFTNECLRDYILRYFGEYGSNYCGNCSNCLSQFETVDVTDISRILIGCVESSRQRYGTNVMIDTVHGANTAKIRNYRMDENPHYGELAKVPAYKLRQVMNHLMLNGYLAVTNDEYAIVKLTGKSKGILEEGEPVTMKMAREAEHPAKASGASAGKGRKGRKGLAAGLSGPGGAEFTEADETLFEKLRAVRTEIAKEEKVPPYMVFSDKTLTHMCIVKPVTKGEMLNVSGVGEFKYEKYGERFLACVQAEMNDSPAEMSFEGDDLYFTSDSDAFDDWSLETALTAWEYGGRENDRQENGSQGNDSREDERTREAPAELNTDRKKKTGKGKTDFVMTGELAARVRYSQQSSLSDFVSQINSLRDEDSMKRLTIKSVEQKLMEDGNFEEYYVNGIPRKRLTDKGREFGIEAEKRLSEKGNEYEVFFYGERAQRGIVEWLWEKI